MKEHYDVCVAGFWYGWNYGSLLNGYAEYVLLKELGKEVLMLQKPDAAANDPEITTGHNTAFVKRYYDPEDVSPVLSYSQLPSLNDVCDCFCAGSDQIWNYDLSFYENMYLPFVNDDKKLISFATSFGHKDDKTPENAMPRIRKYLHRYSAISVREQFDVDILRDNYGIRGTLVFEPVFCIDKKYYLELAERSDFNTDEPYLLTYILDPTPEKREAILYYAEQLGLKTINLLDGDMSRAEMIEKVLNLPNTYYDYEVEDYLKLFLNANYIITDSFHGSAFSIIFNKPFLAIVNPLRGSDRFNDLLGRLKLTDRLIVDQDNIPHDEYYLKPIDYTEKNETIKEEVKRTVEWLKYAIETPKNKMEDIRIAGMFSDGNEAAEEQLKYDKAITNNLDLKLCTGCSACANVCPVGAIEMRYDQQGFIKPTIKDNCVNCGMCTNHCIALNPSYNNNSDPKCYAMMADDDTRFVSSSGGLFTVAAEYILDKGGYVCGAAFNKDFSVSHIIVTDKNELSKLRGSKYLQSNIDNIYKEIRNLLENDKLVLFTGMPCQVAGLYSYLGKRYDGLYTIDIFCHGITSYKVFKKYLRDIHHSKPLKALGFKEKEPWGWHAGVNAYFEDGSHYAEPLERDPYYRVYLGSVSKSTTCGQCIFNRLPRQGDLSIGDFWGIDRCDPAMNDGKGTSAVLLNNEKGSNFFDEIKGRMKAYHEEPLDAAIRGNYIIRQPYRLHKNRDLFFKCFDFLNFNDLTTGCLDNRIYEKIYCELVKLLPKEDMELFWLAKSVAEMSKGRKIITWIRSSRFEQILNEFFGKQVEFGVSAREEALVPGYIERFSVLENKSEDYFLVSLDRSYDNEAYEMLQRYGYKEGKDYIFRIFKPIVLENFDLSKSTYFDEHGNSIEGYNTVIKRVVFRGGNNHIFIGRDTNGENLDFDLTVNANIHIGAFCRFRAPIQFWVQDFNGSFDLTINDRCMFRDSLFRLFTGPNDTSVLINEECTFENKLEVHVNQGKSIIIGRHCMFSYGIDLWAGDAHTIFDVRSGKSTNSDYAALPSRKNNLVIGEHVWVAKGAFIMQGTQVGNGSVIGANSVVKGVFPNNCTIAGNPAAIRSRDIAWSSAMYANNMLTQCGRKEYAALTNDSNHPISGLKVLVVGGTRFMGICLVKELLSLGNKVTIATRGIARDDFGMRVERIKMDVTDAESVKSALDGKHFDVVFDNLAYTAKNVKNVLSSVSCRKYIQLSSIAVYADRNLNLSIDQFDPYTVELPSELSGTVNPDYPNGKKQAEAMVYQQFGNIPTVTVRIPYVTKTDRIYWYCRHVVNGLPMNIPDVSKGFTFIRDTEVGKFLPWIAAQDFTGPINLASEGMVTIEAMLEYIEKKTGKKAIIDISNKEKENFNIFNEDSFTLDMSRAKELGYAASNINDWFWNLMDEYIRRAANSSK